MKVYYSNLELIDDAKARWFPKVQRLFFALQSFGRTVSVRRLAREDSVYGWSQDNVSVGDAPVIPLQIDRSW